MTLTDKFSGKVAIVTGGASGIGRALCEALCRYGANVVVADIDFSQARELVAALTKEGGQAHAVHVDVTSLERMRKLLSETVSTYGRIDYMFNNAAATASRGELCDLPLEAWNRAVDVNFMGALYGTIASYPVMQSQGSGHIVNTASLAGLVGFPTSIPYGATKAALVNLSYSLRMEAAEKGINVSVICPGPVHGNEQGKKLIGVERAARLILEGIKRNEAIIVFPWAARIVWWLYRVSPALISPIGRRLIRDFSEKRTVPAAMAALQNSN